MTREGYSKAAAVTLISSILCSGIAFIPASASAEIVAVQTTTLLETGSTCTPLSAYGFTPYVYENALHSFEFSVPDTSYVALVGSVGDTPIPFQFMTRQSPETDVLRVHVDISTTLIQGVLPISVTLLSANAGGSVCMSTVVMATGVSNGQTGAPSTPATTPTQGTNTGGTSSGGQGGQTSSGNIVTGDSGSMSGGEMASSATPTASTTTSSLLSIGSIQKQVVDLCLAGNAAKLWIVLLAVFVVITVIAVLAQTPNPQSYSESQRAATVLAPFALLALFWYLTEACRVAFWVPIVLVVVALLGLLGIYRAHPKVKPFLNRMRDAMGDTAKQQKLPMTSNTKALITPPPSDKKKDS